VEAPGTSTRLHLVLRQLLVKAKARQCKPPEEQLFMRRSWELLLPRQRLKKRAFAKKGENPLLNTNQRYHAGSKSLAGLLEVKRTEENFWGVVGLKRISPADADIGRKRCTEKGENARTKSDQTGKKYKKQKKNLADRRIDEDNSGGKKQSSTVKRSRPIGKLWDQEMTPKPDSVPQRLKRNNLKP